MNKQTAWTLVRRIAAVLFAALVMGLTGCASSVIVDTSVPMPEQCVILNPNQIHWFDSQRWRYSNSTEVIIPAGSHKIEYAFARSAAYNVPYIERGSLTYDFEAGKSYYIDIKFPSVYLQGNTLVCPDGEIVIKNGEITVFNHNISAKEVKGGISGKIRGNVYTGPEAGGTIDMGWMYRDSVILGMSGRLGVGIISGKFGMKITGKAGFGFGGGWDEYIGDNNIAMLAHAGGIAEFYFPKSGGIGIGGGIVSNILVEDMAPYVELEYILGKYSKNPSFLSSSSFFAQYYFAENALGLLSTLGFGMRFTY
jgi:hypothetical protein